MSANRVQKRGHQSSGSVGHHDIFFPPKGDSRYLSPSQRRRNAVALAEAFGHKATKKGRCSACVQTDTACSMLEGDSMCGACRSKDKQAGECDGVFSVRRFDDLDAYRREALAQADAKDKELVALTEAVQKNREEKTALQARASMLREQQRRMLARELAALDEIDSDDPHVSVTLDSSYDGTEVIDLN